MAASCPWRCAGMLAGVLGRWLGCECVVWTGWDSLARTCREGCAWARMGGSNAWSGLREVWREPLRVPWLKGPWRGPREGAAGQARACRRRAQGVGERERTRPQKVVGARPRSAWDLAPWRGGRAGPSAGVLVGPHVWHALCHRRLDGGRGRSCPRLVEGAAARARGVGARGPARPRETELGRAMARPRRPDCPEGRRGLAGYVTDA